MSDVSSIDCAINWGKDDDVERVEVDDTSLSFLPGNYSYLFDKKRPYRAHHHHLPR